MKINEKPEEKKTQSITLSVFFHCLFVAVVPVLFKARIFKFHSHSLTLNELY